MDPVDPAAERLSMYGEVAEQAPLPWRWVDDELTRAGTYWVVPAPSGGHPHPRPVWGVWLGRRLLLSVGSKVVTRQLADGAAVTVHLESGTDVVVVEGRVRGTEAGPDALAAYDAKYTWHYDVADLGPLTVVLPEVVLAWQAAGWAGREGFRAMGRWHLG